MRGHNQKDQSGERSSRRHVRGKSGISQKQKVISKDALKASEEEIKQLIEASPVAMVVSSGTDEHVEWVNNKFIELFGYTIEDMPDVEHWWPLAYPDEKYREEIKAQWRAKVEQAIRNKAEIEPMEAMATCKDGSQRYVEFRLSSIGERHIVAFVDLTGRRQAEDALQERERHSQSLLRLSKNLERAQTFTEVLNAAHDEVRNAIGYQNLWVYLLSEDKRYFKALIAGGIMSGVVMSEEGTATLTIQGDPMLEEIAEAKDIIVVEDARTDKRTNKEIIARLENRTIVNVPIILFDKRLGSVGMGTFGEEGIRVPSETEQEYLRSMTSHLAVSLDRIHLLVERKRAEQKIKQLAAIVESSDDAIISKSLDGTILSWNRGAEKIYGYAESEMLGRPISTLIPPGYEDEEPQILNRIMSGKFIEHYETIRRRKDGREIFMSLTISPIRDADGRIVAASTIARDITERKRAEEELRKNNVLLERIFSTTEFLIAYLDADFNFIRVNRAYAEADERTPEFFAGKNHFSLYPSTENEAIFRQVVETGEPYIAYAKPFVYTERSERGITYWNWTLQPLKGVDGRVTELVLSLVDVTEREKAVIAQHESDERYRTLIEQASDGIFLADPQGNYLDVNPSGCNMLGYTREEILKLNMRDLVSVESQAKLPLRFDDLRSGKSVISERMMVTKSGALLPVEISGKALDNGNFLGIVRDVTERVRAEEALRRSEQKFRALAENIPNVVYQCRNDVRYSFLYLNDAVEDLTGYPKEEFLENGLGFFDLYHPDDLPNIPKPKENNHSAINCKSFHITYRIRHKSGEWRWVDEWGTGITNPTGEVEYLEGIMIDITERKHHEHEREAIITVSTALRQATTRTGVLNVILEKMMELFEADGTMLVLPDPQIGGFIDEIGRGPVGERMTGLNVPPGKGVCNWVITNKAPYLNNHADRDPIFYRPELLGDAHCLASVPLITHEQVMGAVWVARQVDFMEQDLRLFTAVADIAANALHRIMLYEQTEQQLHHLTALHQIDIAISSNFDSNITLNVILTSVKNELEVDAASILLLNPVTHILEYAAGIGFKTRSIEKSNVKLGDGYAGRAALEYRTVSCPDLKLVRDTFSRSTLIAGEGFAAHYATPLVVKGQVKGVLELFHRKTLNPAQEWLEYFETLAMQAAIAIESASLFENLQRSNLELTLAYDATIEGWSRALDLRDKETEGHTQRVTDMALKLAEKMGVSEAEKMDIWRGSLLHDIGKMGVPDSILHKPGPLSDDEREVIRQHPVYAYKMLSPISYLKRALEISYCHHEKWDGSGYPRGLKGEEIPISARLFAVVDVFDALTSDRPYRKAWPLDDVYRYIKEQAGKHFDPQIVKIFLENRFGE